MDFDPLDFFTVSRKIYDLLREDNPIVSDVSDAWIRTGISRSYYSIFLYIRKNMKLEYYKQHNIHKKILDELKKLSNSYRYMGKIDKGKKYYIIYTKLFDLRKRRTDADYERGKRYSVEDLEETIEIADDIIRIAKQIPW